MAEKPKYYWDACMWLALINREPRRFDACRHIIEKAQRGEIEIWTSTFTLAEVWKRRCGSSDARLEEKDDEAFEDYIEQDFVVRVQLDNDVGIAARRLLRRFPGLGKPQDAIHVASAVIYDLDELHTFDHSDLLRLSGEIPTPSGRRLKICRPPDPDDGTLFEKRFEEAQEDDVTPQSDDEEAVR